MANIQYYTTVQWDDTIREVGTDEEGLAIDAIRIVAGAPAAVPRQWRPGALVQNQADTLLYRNEGSTVSPSWVVVGTGGGSPSAPDTSVQYNNAGSFFGDSLFTRDPSTKETDMLFEVSAIGFITDSFGDFAVVKADNPGSAGNSITLTFDGVVDVDTALATWNAANPSNTVSVVQGNDTIVPDPQTVNLVGGGESGYELSFDLLGQGIEFTGSIISDGVGYAGINGLLGAFDPQRPFVGAFDFVTGFGSQAIFEPNNINISSNDPSDSQARVNLVSDSFARIGYFPDLGSDQYFYADASSLRLANSGIEWFWPNLDGNPGDALVTDGAGNLSFAPVSGTATLGDTRIGVGNNLNQLDGYADFTYDANNYFFGQRIPNNAGNGGTLTSPLSFGPLSWNSVGVDDLTLTWDSANYGSEKYGGNLTIQIDGTGTPDTFYWIYTGSYSQVLGGGVGNIPITAGPITLTDVNGNEIAQIEFASTTGHTGGESWTAGTSLAGLQWGMSLFDADSHQFLRVSPVIGTYIFGDDNTTTKLAGNGTRVQITDNLAELGLFAKRYLRIEKPGTGGYTAAFFDFPNERNLFYGGFRALDVPTSTTWVDFDTVNQIFQVGDVQSASTETLFNVNVIAELILGKTDGEFIIQNTAGNQSLYISPSNYNIILGDINGDVNSTSLFVDDFNSQISVRTDGSFFVADNLANILLNADTSSRFSVSINGGIATSKHRNGGNSTPIAIVDGDYIVYAGSGSIGATFNLPAASGLADGTIIIVKDYYGHIPVGGSFYVAPNGTDTIDGSNSSYQLLTQYQSVTLVLNKADSNWMIID